MERRPKILILGNGFDLAHYLPTSYTHFMKAMMVLEESEIDTEISFNTLFSDYIKNDNEFISKTKNLYKTDEFILSVDIANQLRKKLKTNGWFQHFKNYLTKIDTWIDFETEIENVLLIFSEALTKNFEKNTIKTCRLDNVMTDNEKDFNHLFFDDYQIAKTKILELFKDFELFKDIYVLGESLQTHKGTKYTRVTESEYISTVASRISNGFNTKHHFPYVISNKYLERFSDDFIGFKIDEVFKTLSTDLETFTHIFEFYISEIINKLKPKKPFKYKGDVLGHPIKAVFTFNYSSSFERFYPKCELKFSSHVQYLHGNADERNTVLGISDLNEKLKKHKIYSFVKTYQKIINKTDYDFLQDTDLFDRKEKLANGEKLGSFYEIIIWGHSLDSSDAEYIKELFKLNNQRGPTNIQITVWYHKEQHALLANLMHIMGKDIIQEWMKKRWLRFEPSMKI